MPTAVGIDLGTTNSCVAYYKDGRAEVIPNSEGDRTTPSYVFYGNEEPIVGALAKEKTMPSNGIFDVKRLMGQQFDDPKVQAEIALLPFEVVKGADGDPEYKIPLQGGTVYKKPEEVSAEVLKKMMQAAKDKLGDGFVSEAVITVPAYFNNNQREATKKAADLVGLKVLRLLNEPTAAAIAYIVGERVAEEETLAVFDLGGGTFDISVIKVNNSKISVLAIDGDSHLGGKNFDDRLVAKFVGEIEAKHGVDVTKNGRSLRRLRMACEEAKKRLSFKRSTSINLEYFVNGDDVSLELTRDQFDGLNSDLFAETIDILKRCLRDARLTKSDIDEVILVGGSGRIVKIQTLLSDFFDGRELCKKLNLDEAVAMGAAIQAELLSSDPGRAIEDIVLTDVVAISLGTDVVDPRLGADFSNNSMSFIIKKNTPLPARNTRAYKTVKDDQSFMTVKILEGEDEKAARNLWLGEMQIDGLTRAPKGQVRVEVTFLVDLDGILNVTAIETFSGRTKQLQITLNRAHT